MTIDEWVDEQLAHMTPLSELEWSAISRLLVHQRQVRNEPSTLAADAGA